MKDGGLHKRVGKEADELWVISTFSAANQHHVSSPPSSPLHPSSPLLTPAAVTPQLCFINMESPADPPVQHQRSRLEHVYNNGG